MTNVHFFMSSLAKFLADPESHDERRVRIIAETASRVVFELETQLAAYRRIDLWMHTPSANNNQE
jgi:hypothetical protein